MLYDDDDDDDGDDDDDDELQKQDFESSCHGDMS